MIRSQIKPLCIVKHNKFPEICGDDCDPSRVIHCIFPIMNTPVFPTMRLFFNYHKFILYLGITPNKPSKNKQNIKSLAKPILKTILLISVFLKNSL